MNVSPNDGTSQGHVHGVPDNADATTPTLEWHYLDGDQECGPNATRDPEHVFLRLHADFHLRLS